MEDRSGRNYIATSVSIDGERLCSWPLILGCLQAQHSNPPLFFLMKPLGNVICQFRIQYQYANDTQCPGHFMIESVRHDIRGTTFEEPTIGSKCCTQTVMSSSNCCLSGCIGCQSTFGCNSSYCHHLSSPLTQGLDMSPVVSACLVHSGSEGMCSGFLLQVILDLTTTTDPKFLWGQLWLLRITCRRNLEHIPQPQISVAKEESY